MDKIYAVASLTIVAAAGTDANAGLPGFWPTMRAGQHADSVQRMTLVNQLSTTREVLGVSCWNNCASTYQERMFSQRMLAFSESQEHFRTTCCNSTLSENLMLENSFQASPIQDSTTLRNNVQKFYNYELAVANYTRCNVGFDTDALNVFIRNNSKNCGACTMSCCWTKSRVMLLGLELVLCFSLPFMRPDLTRLLLLLAKLRQLWQRPLRFPMATGSLRR